ncbi:UbiA family prenyltransferase [Methanolobus sp. ZRKC4]|uniref:UbiA family prenyltransferase n=1 Tax=Methanolobus sp. ZRKC4 TaxID=3125787 RepID=UPI0032432336
MVRFENALFGALTIFLSGILSSDISGHIFEYGLASISVVFLGMGFFAVNDYFDFEIDRANCRTDRPIAQGKIKRKTALYVGVASLILSFLVSLGLNQIVSLLLIFNAVLFFAYSYYLKKIFLVKNIIMAYGFLSMILVGTLVSDYVIEALIFYYAIMGFIVGLAFEIMIDIRDMEGDREFGVQTLPLRTSSGFAASVFVILYVLVMILDPLPYFVNIDSLLYHDFFFLILIMIPVIFYIFISKSLLRDMSKSNVGRLRERTINVMQLGSLAYLFGYLL